MKKLIIIILVLSCILVISSCNKPDAPIADTPIETSPDNIGTTDGNEEQIPDVQTPTSFDYLTISIGEDYDNIKSVTAYFNEDGTLHIEYVGENKKVGDFDADTAKTLLEAIESSGLKELNGRNDHVDGEANGSMYIGLSDGSFIGASFSGVVPEEYSVAYDKFDKHVQDLVKDLPVYVPRPLVEGNINEEDLELIESILYNGGIEYLDSYIISEVALGEHFAFRMGLSTDEGILRGVTFGPIMMPNAYGLSMVVLNDDTSVEDVCKDFENNIDWGKWVCVTPNDGVIAVKGNIVICLLGSDPVFSQTLAGIEASGFEVWKTYKNPDLN